MDKKKPSAKRVTSKSRLKSVTEFNTTHYDLMMLVYLYLDCPKNTELEYPLRLDPSLMVIGQILRRLSTDSERKTTKAVLGNKFRSKARIELERLGYTVGRNPGASMNQRQLSEEAIERFQALGFVGKSPQKLTRLGNKLIDVIDQFANEFRAFEFDEDFSGKPNVKYGIQTKGEVITVIDLAADIQVARFTAPEDVNADKPNKKTKTKPERIKGRGKLVRTQISVAPDIKAALDVFSEFSNASMSLIIDQKLRADPDMQPYIKLAQEQIAKARIEAEQKKTITNLNDVDDEVILSDPRIRAAFGLDPLEPGGG